jgi:hypothetical protein
MSLRPFPRAEKFLSERAPDDLPALELTDVASDVLGVVMERIELPDVEGVPDDAWIQTKAVVYLGLLAGRSARGAAALLRCGYDSEALLFKRRLDEIHARIQRVTDNDHGPDRAREWLAGRDRKPSAVVELPDGAWHLHSHVAHADYRAVEHHLVEIDDSGRTILTLLPHRDPVKGNATAVMCAMLTRDVAAVIADFRGLRINGLDALDAALHEGADRWLVPEDDDEDGE